VKFSNNTYSSNPVQEARDATSKYITDLSQQVLEQLKDEYPNEKDYRIAEIALNACSKLLATHFFEKARFGKKPTD